MLAPYRIRPDLVVLHDAEPVPGFGVLPIQSFLLLGDEPILVDAGAARTSRAFVEQLGGVLDPQDLRFIVVTHPDGDHAGALPALLELAPRAELVLDMVSTGKLGASLALPLPRVRWVNPGQGFVAGDRELHALRAPMYDCPSTTCFFDSKSRALFASDAFGAFVAQPAERFGALDAPAALDGMSRFCRANSPWLADVRPERFAEALRPFVELGADWLLPSHLPPVPARDAGLVLARALRLPGEGALALPDQQALDALRTALSAA